MKKKYLYLLFTIYFLLFAFAVKAASPTPSPASDVLGQQTVNELKNRIASKVAQLKLVEKRGVLGTVTDVSDTQITISDIHNNTRFIDVDEFTKFSSPSAKTSFGISDIKKGTAIGVLGLYNKESQRILARFINVVDIPQYIYGNILSIDKKNFTFTLSVKDSKEPAIIDVQDTTRTFSFVNGTKLVSSGFSKIVENESVIVVGFSDINNKNSIIATRIILLPDILSSSSSPSATIIPSPKTGKNK